LKIVDALVAHLQPIRRRLGLRIVFDRAPDPSRSVLLAGTGRSGGSWICEFLNQHNEYRYVFEPFHPKNTPWAARFPARRYMRPDEQDPEFLGVISSVVTGRSRHPWTERFNRRLIAHQRLIKANYANLMLKWLHVNFPGMPLVLLLRHPCAVALSFVSHGYRGAVLPLLDQDELVEDHLEPYVEDIRRARDVFERTVFLWCVETLVPLRQCRPDELHVVLYERMVREPEAEVRGLLEHLGIPAAGLDIARLARPSLTARRATSAAWTGADRVTAWQDRIDGAQRERAAEILSLFGLDRIYSDDPIPRMEGPAEIMSESRDSGHASPPDS